MVDFGQMADEAKKKVNELTDDDKGNDRNTQQSDPQHMTREDRQNTENTMP